MGVLSLTLVVFSGVPLHASVFMLYDAPQPLFPDLVNTKDGKHHNGELVHNNLF